MRRAWADWLILPFLLLPILGFGLFVRYAEERHRAEGEALVRQPMSLRRFQSLRDGFLDAARFARIDYDYFVEWPDQGTRLRIRRPKMGSFSPSLWIFTDRYPGGAKAADLARAATRFKLEAGTAPVAAKVVGEEAALFARLLHSKEVRELAAAPLPQSTKRYIADRWSIDEPGRFAWLRALLDEIRVVEPTPPGIDFVSGNLVVSAGPDQPPLMYRDGSGLKYRHTEVRGDFSLGFSTVKPQTARSLVWLAERDSPVRGWYYVVDHGENAFFDRWIGLVSGVALVLLAAPILLLWKMRRQRALDEARVRFLTEVAHDLRTPLTAVRLHAEMLTEERVPEARRGKYLDTVARESARLSGLLANLLDLTRLERGRREFQPETLVVSDVVQTAIHDFVALFPDRAGDIRTEGPPRNSVRADRTALTRCLANLLENAGKFTQPGSAIRIAWERSGLIKVTDDGPGVPPGDRKRLFDRYARGRAAQRDGVPGTGLGLSLVRELARGMDGDAWLEGSSTFVIQLPGGVT